MELDVPQLPGRGASSDCSRVWQRKGVPGAVPTHILGGFPQDVPHAAAVAQAVVEDGDDAHEQRVTGTFPLLWLSFWGGEQGKGSEHSRAPEPGTGMVPAAVAVTQEQLLLL